MIWYQVHPDSVWKYVDEVLRAIHLRINNVNLPQDEAGLRKQFSAWEGIQHRRYGKVLAPHLCGAMDGFVIECTKRTEHDLQGRDFAQSLIP